MIMDMPVGVLMDLINVEHVKREGYRLKSEAAEMTFDEIIALE